MRPLLIACLALMPALAQAAPVFHFGTAPYVPTYLEDFEDGKLDIPGVTATSGYLDRPGGPLVAADGGTFFPSTYWIQYTIPEINRTGLRFDLDQPVAAVGFLLTQFPADNVVLRVLEADGAKTDLGKPLSELTLPSFIGVESANGIAAFQITSETVEVLPIFQIDNLQYVLPEPSALVLSIVGIVCLVAWRKR